MWMTYLKVSVMFDTTRQKSIYIETSNSNGKLSLFMDFCFQSSTKIVALYFLCENKNDLLVLINYSLTKTLSLSFSSKIIAFGCK